LAAAVIVRGGVHREHPNLHICAW